MEEWKQHVYRVGKKKENSETPPQSDDDIQKKRREIEPWLTAVFQSEHFSLLVGNGLTTAVAKSVGVNAASMAEIKFDCDLEDKVNAYAAQLAKRIGRGSPNIEDQIRAANALIDGLKVMGDSGRLKTWSDALKVALGGLTKSVLACEKRINDVIRSGKQEGSEGRNLLESFIMSFASRVASRERPHIFTTNYDRLIEYGCDILGLHVLDRFVGVLNPVFRSSRLDIDLHYNPPGIRGEPRFLEGVVKMTKLHGSIDWCMQIKDLRKYAIPFGAEKNHSDLPKDPSNQAMIYPNAAKDMETLEYPYAELFRDFSSALCRPNSALVIYGYGFGDDHINRVIRDMLTIPSTHLVIISYDDKDKRIHGFCEQVNKDAQITLLIGEHYGSLQNLVDYYLPKPAIDLITYRKTELLERRGVKFSNPGDEDHDKTN